MLPRLQRQLDAMERRRLALLTGLESLTDEQRTFRPSPDAWSIVDVLDHVTLSEYHSSRWLARWVERTEEFDQLGLAPRFRSAALNAALRSPIRFRVPPGAKGVTPDGSASFTDVCARWEESRTRLQETLDAVPAEALGKAALKHPIAGWLTLTQALLFFDTHLIHHERQIRRIRRSSAFP